MPRPILATVHLSAIKNNLNVIRQHAPNSHVWAVVKGNAFGHGIERVYDAFRSADGFALLDIQEAERIRHLGWRSEILLLEGVFEPRDLETCSRLGLSHTVHCDEQIDWLAAHKTHQPHHVFLKLNGGMNRLGFKPESYRSAWARLNALPQVKEITLMMHFSDADGEKGISEQMDIFLKTTEGLAGERSLCNSAATLRFAKKTNVAQDWVRPGIALYGASPNYPSCTAEDWQLQPAMSLQSKIIGTQELKVGDTVGYGSLFVADKPMTIGIVACGYADGYPRICPTGTPVLINGQRSRTIGRVSMDMLAVDLSMVPNSGFGSEVVLWGKSSKEFGEKLLSVDEVAAYAQTLGYELLTAVTARVPFEVEPL